MLHLIAQLYADDALRFGLWSALDHLHVSGIVAWGIDLAGFHLFEDFSISR